MKVLACNRLTGKARSRSLFEAWPPRVVQLGTGQLDCLVIEEVSYVLFSQRIGG
jgi:hypothetical protein